MPPDPPCVPDIQSQNTTDAPPPVSSDVSANHEAATLPPSSPPLRADADNALPFAEKVLLAGKYRLLQILGEGGMGAVWHAEQIEPVRRHVAVKLIKIGLDSEQVLARFEAERQALAVMDHPNIAKVLDAGVDERGQPFFVMELVQGVPLTRFCDEARLTVRQRLELFVPICQAVQHAHQKGVIHRDLKPSNILVALYDGKAIPKVIDFGIAKATGQKLTAKTLQTQLGAVVGTLEYMSPEQAGGATDIDTRSDIYSLGVILYELLTGTTPLGTTHRAQGALLDLLVRICEEEPPRPSLRLGMLEKASSVASSRQSDPTRLAKQLRVDLDWIVMKALDKDRARRYETANGLAADVLRYMDGEALLAHPPSTAYRLKKFVKRYKGQVIAAGVVVLALVAGIVGTTLGLLEAKKQEAEAKRQEGLALAAAEKEKSAKLVAEKNLAFVKKGNDILGLVFTKLDPQKNYATVGEFSQALKDNLKKAVQELEGSAIGDPLTVAQMQKTLGESLLGLGEPSQAIGLFKKAWSTLASVLGPEHPLTLSSMNNLTTAYLYAGKLDLALPLLEGSLKERKAKFGPNHPDTLASMSNLASCYQAVGKLDRALPLFEETLKSTKAKVGPAHPRTLQSMTNLATAYWAAGKPDRALPLMEETMRLRRVKLGPDHPDTLASMSNLAEGYKSVLRLDLALPLMEKTLRLRRIKLGPDHPDTLASMNNLAGGYKDAGRLDRALSLYEETLRLRRVNLGPDHPHTLTSMNNLAAGYWSARQLDKSVPLFEETLKLQVRKLGRQHPDTQLTVANLGFNYKYAGRVQEALPLLEEAFQTSKTNPNLRWVGRVLLDGYAKAGKPTEAAKLVTELLADARIRFPKNSPQLAGELAQFGWSVLQAHAFADAETLLRECLTIREKTQPNAWATFNTMSTLGGALLGQKKYADAEPLLHKGYEGMKQREKTIPLQGATRIPEALDRLIELYTATNKPEEAKKWRAQRAKYPQAKKPVAPQKK